MAETTHNPAAGANAGRSLSADGVRSLQYNEGLRRVYYNDSANNCTYGVGTLAHLGACRPGELGHTVPDTLIERSLGTGIRQAEQVVRDAVPGRELTQEQFDAAVSFAYNRPRDARTVLAPANHGDMAGVARNINAYVYEHHRDAHGRRTGHATRSGGLVARRSREAAPFMAPPAPSSLPAPARPPAATEQPQ